MIRKALERICSLQSLGDIVQRGPDGGRQTFEPPLVMWGHFVSLVESHFAY